LAFAISFGLHEAAAGLVPRNVVEASPREIVTHARILTVAVRPVATPVPRRLKPRRIRNPRVSAKKAPAAPARRLGTHSNPHNTIAPRTAVRSEPAQFANSKPVWDVEGSIAGAASGKSAGSGNGSGTQGNGSGSASANAPCGFVVFSDPHGSQFDPRTRGFWVDIRMSVHFADGSSQSTVLDYPWYYADESANPWSDQNLRDPSFPTRFQSPPPNKIAGEPPLVQYVVTHSTPDGLTLLKDCPESAPTPPVRNR
jgi:hypothetical protein